MKIQNGKIIFLFIPVVESGAFAGIRSRGGFGLVSVVVLIVRVDGEAAPHTLQEFSRHIFLSKWREEKILLAQWRTKDRDRGRIKFIKFEAHFRTDLRRRKRENKENQRAREG